MSGVPSSLPTDQGKFLAIVQTADQLLNEGRYAEALTLYDRLLQAYPGNLVVAINAAQAASQQGDHVAALRRAKGFGAISRPDLDPTPYIDIIKAHATAAFNASLSANDLERAAAIIDGLIELDPAAYLPKGVSVAQALGASELVASYAGRLLQINPSDWYAHFACSEIAKQRGLTASWLHHATRAILLRPWTDADQHLSISSIVYYLVTDILAHPEHAEALAYIHPLREKVFANRQGFSAEDDRELDRFMRIGLDNTDITVLECPIADEPPPEPALAYFDTHGVTMTAAQWQSRIRAVSPRLVFLAVADEGYLTRYGRNYVRSLLERCDVGCAVIIGLVGQAARLKSTIDAIGVTDDRLFYLVDEFDPAYAVTYHTSTERRTDCASAYYQSARFLVLEHILALLHLPIIVTDIDLHLQGSVATLLAQHADADVVLNRNAHSTSYATRFTANLTLLRPSLTARQFARMLRLFLQQALRQPQIHQFIDQIAFTLAHYYCQQHGLNGFGDFLDNEINNVMLNEANLEPGVMALAKSFVFLAYYGSQGESAVSLMQATGMQTPGR
jgi:tetratricopeptide (TPR) repeat protein